MYRILSITTLAVLYVAVPTLAILPAVMADNLVARLLLLGIAPALCGALFAFFAGLLSRPFQSAVKPGLFPRDLAHPVYLRRRLYGLCWTAVYYMTPVYHILLSVPLFKWGLFRLFGYRGPLNFTIYPDTWVRDLPLLHFGKGAYLSNKATLGTNLYTPNVGKILVGSITLGNDSLLGHSAIFGTDAKLGDRAEIGMGALVGIRVRLEADSSIGAGAGIDHETQIGESTSVGPFAYIGQGVQISNRITIPAGAYVPAGVAIRRQEDFDDLLNAETSSLKKAKTEELRKLAAFQFRGDDAP